MPAITASPSSRAPAGRAPDRSSGASLADLAVAAVVFGWITVVLYLDRDAGLTQQRVLGVATWVMLIGLLRREVPLVRMQVGVVVVFATAVEYTFSPLLEVYVYRLENVPSFVPPGHGLIYLCALALGRTIWFHRFCRPLTLGVVVVGGGWAAWGLWWAERPDALGAFWFACLVGFLCLGRSRTLYLGAFLIVSYLELLGTHLHTWTWQPEDPTGLVSIGNPPSGAAGGYGWFDLAALYAGPVLLRRCSLRSTGFSRLGSMITRSSRSCSARLNRLWSSGTRGRRGGDGRCRPGRSRRRARDARTGR